LCTRCEWLLLLLLLLLGEGSVRLGDAGAPHSTFAAPACIWLLVLLGWHANSELLGGKEEDQGSTNMLVPLALTRGAKSLAERAEEAGASTSGCSRDSSVTVGGKGGSSSGNSPSQPFVVEELGSLGRLLLLLLLLRCLAPPAGFCE